MNKNKNKSHSTKVKQHFIKIWGEWRLADRAMVYGEENPTVWFVLKDDHGNMQTGWVKKKFHSFRFPPLSEKEQKAIKILKEIKWIL